MYWQNDLHDVLAMLRALGTPIFLTLSAADLCWPEMIKAVVFQCGIRLSREDMFRMSMLERSEYL